MSYFSHTQTPHAYLVFNFPSGKILKFHSKEFNYVQSTNGNISSTFICNLQFRCERLRGKMDPLRIQGYHGKCHPLLQLPRI